MCKNIPIVGKLPPILLAGVGVILVLKLFNIDFEYYNKSASYLTLMLIPATIALGYPIYKYKELLIKNKRIIYSAFLSRVKKCSNLNEGNNLKCSFLSNRLYSLSMTSEPKSLLG